MSCLAQPSQDLESLEQLIESGAPFIFLTGKAGTGKTTLLKKVYEKYKSSAVKIAPTGVAALNIDGQTIHKFFKFPPRMFDVREIAVRKPNDVISCLTLLIIDEISMVRADLLDNINEILKIWRKTDEPFGGIQVLAVGDLFQLPPILKDGTETEIFYSRYKSTWFFDAHAFEQVSMSGVNLEIPFRQKDERFVEALDNLRLGKDPEDTVDWLNGSCLKESFEIDSSVTLTGTNQAAESYNQRKFDSLKGEEVIYHGKFDGKFELANKNLPAPQQLRLKIGAQVMVVRNQPSAANGTICRVVDLDPKKVQLERVDDGNVLTLRKAKWEQVEYNLSPQKYEIEAVVSGVYTQFPLTLGWAVTIHKSQGLTIDSILLDLGNRAFASGQAYVGLSRSPSASNVSLARPLQPQDIIVDPVALQFMSELFE